MLKFVVSAMFCLTIVLPVSAYAYSIDPGPYPPDYVPAWGDTVYYETFRGGEPAYIDLEGDCRSDIDLWVYDEYGNLVAKSTSYGCYESVEFFPRWTGQFKIVVENHGKPNGSEYWLTTY